MYGESEEIIENGWLDKRWKEHVAKIARDSGSNLKVLGYFIKREGNFRPEVEPEYRD